MRMHSALAFAVASLAAAACARHDGASFAPQPPAPPAGAAAAAESGAPPSAPEATPSMAHRGSPLPAPTPAPAVLTARPLDLPGATPPVSLDYIAYERAVRDKAPDRVWIPVGDTGSVDVLDVAAGTFARINGFQTQQREVRGKTRVMGPSAVTIGDGVAYIGNRATSEVCAIDVRTLKLGMCLKLSSPTDGVAYVASAKEVWVTTPRDESLTVLDASRPEMLKTKAIIKLDGAPEGYAVDDSRGLFFTNLEDKNRTVAIDVKTHTPKATWKTQCGADGPRGIATDASTGFVLVACTDHVQVLDGTHDGAPLARIDTGAGVDNIDWSDAHRLLYVASAKAAMLTVARIDDKGGATVVAKGVTAEGARNGVADGRGNAYVADPVHARVLLFSFAP